MKLIRFIRYFKLLKKKSDSHYNWRWVKVSILVSSSLGAYD